VHGDTLVVLVERRHVGTDGIRPLALDWYYIDLAKSSFTEAEEQQSNRGIPVVVKTPLTVDLRAVPTASVR
jgi:hypothetical protein